MNLLRLALAAAITLSTLKAAAPATPTCASKTGQYPCTLGGTLLLLAQPTGNATSFVGNAGNSGSFIDDPQNPGLAASTSPLTFGGAAIPFLISNLNLTTVNGQATMNGVRGSFALRQAADLPFQFVDLSADRREAHIGVTICAHRLVGWGESPIPMTGGRRILAAGGVNDDGVQPLAY